MKYWLQLYFCVFFLFLSPLFATDWPGFRGPQHNGKSLEVEINKDWNKKVPTILWEYPLSDNGYSGPCAADGRIFIIDHLGNQDIVRAINQETGELDWKYAYEDAARDKYGFARSTPLYENGKLYTISRLGKLFCFQASDGQVLWQKDIVEEYNGKLPGWDLSASPYIDKEKLLVIPGGSDAHLVALNKNSGKIIWKGGGSDIPGYATPFLCYIDNRNQYIIFNGKYLIGVDPLKGKKLWQFRWKTSYKVNAATPVFCEKNRLFISSGYRTGCAMVEIKDNEPIQLWKNKSMAAHFSSPIYHEGYIYGNSDPDNLVCIDVVTGKRMWSAKGFEKGGVIMIDGALIAISGNRGDVVLVDVKSDSYNELGRIKPLNGQCWTSPIVADKKLIVRNREKLVCIDIS